MKIIMPHVCPSCDSKLQQVNNILYCRNPQCPAKSGKSIQHFCKALKIKGMGPATIDKLQLQNYWQVYQLTYQYIKEKLKSQALSKKLIQAIQLSKNNNLNNLLPALGIPLVGNSVTEKVAGICQNFFDISQQTLLQAKVGPKARQNILTWLSDNHKMLIDTFPENMLKFKNRQKAGNKGIVCISGRLTSVKTKQQATSLLQGKGYIVNPSMTKQVTILINQSAKQTIKTKKARQSGVIIIENLNELIGE